MPFRSDHGGRLRSGRFGAPAQAQSPAIPHQCRHGIVAGRIPRPATARLQMRGSRAHRWGRPGQRLPGRLAQVYRRRRAHERPGSPGCPPGAHPLPRWQWRAEHADGGVQVGGTVVCRGICPSRCPGIRSVSRVPAAAPARRDGRGARAKWGQNIRNPPRFPWRDHG
jgi:hypothetical protein